jgi:hypothetical protein
VASAMSVIQKQLTPGIHSGTPVNIDPRLAGMTSWMKSQRDGDFASGESWADKYFNTPEIQELLKARKDAAFGTDNRETQLARESGTEGINRSVQTALRQFQGRMPGTGVRGGAAGAMAGMLTRDAVGQTRGLERDLALADMERKRQALAAYESTLTGERAGKLGATLGYAGLGSQDRYGGMGYLASSDFLNAARDAAAGGGGGGGGKDEPWWKKIR